MRTAPRCPNCGRALAHVVAAADTAPWLCQPCARGWWQCEVTAQAAKAWDPAVQSVPLEAATALMESAEGERAAAVVRGVSVRPDMLPLLSKAELQAVAGRAGVAAGFVAVVQAALKVAG